MIRLPLEQTGFKQLNLGDRLGLGDLWSSFNLSLSKKLGSLMASGRMILNINTDDDAQLDEPPSAFKSFISSSPDIWAIAGDFMWSSSTGGPNDTFAQDATASTPSTLDSDNSDLLVAFQVLIASPASSRNVPYLNTSKAWATINNGIATTAGMHQMTFFRAQNRVYIVDDNGAGISSIDSALSPTNVAASTQYTLNDLVDGSGVSVGSEISCMSSNSNRIGIGTINRSGSTCRFYTWDGSQSSGPNESYIVDASGILTVIVVDDVFTIFTTRGQLMQLNGGTFVEIARLPLEEAPLKLPVTLATDRPVHFNGMSLVDGNIEILINTQLWDTNSTIREKCPSGIWCYDRETRNFYHKRSIGHTKSGGTIVEYGQSKINKVGALAEVEVPSTSITQGSVNGKIMAGVQYYTDATTTKNGIFYDDSNDTLQKAFSFVTQKIYTQDLNQKALTSIWQWVYLVLGRRLLNSTDKIVFKARNREEEATEATITYTSTTTFTVPTASFTTAPAVGDEVEILQGVGAGRCAHLTVVTTNGSNYEVTVDETITGATTQTAKARFQTWKKIFAFTQSDDSARDILDSPIDLSQFGASPWLQVKVWGLLTGKNEISSLIISNKAQEAIE